MMNKRVLTEFDFTVDLPYEDAFPLFGAWEERKWAKDWKPKFAYPDPPADIEGAVFEATHGDLTSAWVCTRIDFAEGLVQYVNVLGGMMVTRIDIEVSPNGEDKTDVSVAYERTALNEDGMKHMSGLAAHDEKAGDAWRDQINAYAKTLKRR
jgi:hypothetical protein